MDYNHMRITPAEQELIKKLYSGESGQAALKLLRKIFLPVYDPEAPIGQQVDLFWTSLSELGQMPPQDRELAILARTRLINHVEQQLMQLHVLAEQKKDGAPNPKDGVK